MGTAEEDTVNKFPANWREGLDLPGAMVSETDAEEAREEAYGEPDALMRDYIGSTYRGGRVPEEYARWA